MFGSSDPPSVDTALLEANRAGMDRMAEFGEGAVSDYDMYRQEMQGYTTELMQNVVGQQMEAFTEQLKTSQALFDIAGSDRALYESTYLPLQQQVVQDAQDWDSEVKTRQAMGEAQANVSDSFDAAKRNQRNQLESYGIDPSMTRGVALDRGLELEKAAAKAAEGNKARQARELQGIQLRAGAAQQGDAAANRALATYGAGQRGLASAVGSGAQTTGTANATSGANLNNTAGGQQMAAGVGGQYGAINNDYLNQYQQQLAEYEATTQTGEVLAGLGSSVLGGMAGGGAFNPLVTAGMSAAGIPMAEGGTVPTPEAAGVPAMPGPDRTPARLTPGEFIIPEDTVRWKGEEYFHNQVMKAREGRSKQGGIPQGAAA